MTHDELVTRAARWLRTSKRCGLVLREIGTEAEQPDAIGWAYRGTSFLVECKATVDDYRKDAKKFFRRDPERGMGRLRYWFAPPDVAEAIAGHLHSASLGLGPIARVEHLALKWGVVACLPRGHRLLRQPLPFERFNERAERTILVSACRRATEGWGRKVFGEAAPPLVDGDPGPTTAKVIAALRAENRKLRCRETAEIVELTRKLELASVEVCRLRAGRGVEGGF
jgi:hypothetical protein